MTTTLLLAGNCPAKKNLWKRGKSRQYLDTAVKAEIDALTLQAQSQWAGKPPVEHPDLSIRFHVGSARRDRDGMFTTVLDCLQEAGVLVNDNVRRNNGRTVLEPCRIVKAGRECVEIEISK